MLGAAIAERVLARDGLGLLSGELGRTRLAEAPVPAWGRAGSSIGPREEGTSARRAGAAAASRP